ncbi:flagellar biosynthesis protein FlhB [Nocardioides sp. Leaf307]|uniref:EscU/YscU/HrcU family type III secretion system export apparatus switch protein n=1 Tax=Nocardioides sp. Leaf307 TaxID=1736331 RepID=UPI0007029CAF|nr:EscU/YscU/HrcU family type III secretion system export apparatus switch protein [Nocardioides sp. Leaf307]KQQ39739.1 type III secretion protein [Nocardioides sp. Leaf307]
MSGSSGEKTEKPTPKKLKESRKEGQVARTQELGPWIALTLAAMVMPLLLTRELDAMQRLMTACLRAVEDPSPERAMALLGEGVGGAFLALVVLASAVAVVSVAGTLAQGGFYLATKAVKPTFSKLDPIKGAKRIFGPQALWEGVKMLAKCSVVAILVWSSIKALMPLLGGMVPMGVVLTAGGEHALALLRNVAVAGVLLAGVDYGMQRRRVGKQTRMTKDEVKQEHKMSEGDPLVKSAIRARQLAAARNRMIADVPTADVVLVNPTHVAVALRYDAQRGAPLVVARGAGAVAARIREVATEAEVPLVQDVPLARALHASCEVGHEIPAELFGAVAHVLAFVISRKRQGRRGGSHRSPRLDAALPTVPRAGRRRRRTAPVVPAISSDPAPSGR